MSHHNEKFPKLPLYAGVALIFSTLLLVAFVRISGMGDVRTPQASVVAQRMLQFRDLASGGISIVDADRSVELEQIAPETNGFLRGTLRGLARERKREGIGAEAPFRLTGRSDGRLLLEDPTTQRLIDLGAFGPTNAAVFARLLTEAPASATTGAPSPRSGALAARSP